MDIVITYVDKNEPVWLKAFNKACAEAGIDPAAVSACYDPWDTFRFVFRGIAKYMPYIGNIFLVVSNKEQVPEWVNTEKVNIVLHKDFMPEKLLPTFNSVTIEFFLHKIKGLDNEFIYFNDDFFVIGDVAENELFQHGKPCICATPASNIDPKFANTQAHAFNILSKDAALDVGSLFLTPHGPRPLTKQAMRTVWRKFGDYILPTLGPMRDWRRDLTPNLFSAYQILSDNYIPYYPRLFFVDGLSDVKLCDVMTNEYAQYLCINDSNWQNTEKVKKECFDLLYARLPEKCKYEK